MQYMHSILKTGYINDPISIAGFLYSDLFNARADCFSCGSMLLPEPRRRHDRVIIVESEKVFVASYQTLHLMRFDSGYQGTKYGLIIDVAKSRIMGVCWFDKFKLETENVHQVIHSLL